MGAALILIRTSTDVMAKMNIIFTSQKTLYEKRQSYF